MNLLRILNLNMKVKVTKFKGDLSEIVKDFLNFQEKYASFYNSDDLDDILDKGKEKPKKFQTLKMEKAMGLGRKDNTI